jgi:hypothetical protein
MRGRLSFGLLLLLLTSCGRVDTREARALVERYNHLACEAYRRGDAALIEPVAGPAEARKLTALIGVRLDAGVTLDAELLTLAVTGVEQAGDELRIRTRETWRYRHLRIGSGEPVGEPSRDAYSMLYVFMTIGGHWKVDRIRFTEAPDVEQKPGLRTGSTHIPHGDRITQPSGD